MNGCKVVHLPQTLELEVELLLLLLVSCCTVVFVSLSVYMREIFNVQPADGLFTVLIHQRWRSVGVRGEHAFVGGVSQGTSQISGG